MGQLKTLPLVSKIPPAILVFLLVQIGLSLAYIANYLTGELNYKITGILHLNSEKSICTWFSIIQFFCIAMLSMLYTFKNVKQDDRKSWLLVFLPVIYLVFSIDETIQLHEGIGGTLDCLLPGGTRIGTTFETTGIWMFAIGIPFMAVFLLWAWSARSLFTQKVASWKRVMAGMLIFLSGALCLEVYANFVVDGSFGDFMEVLLEENLEMYGATMMFWGVYGLTIEYIQRIGLKDENID